MVQVSNPAEPRIIPGTTRSTSGSQDIKCRERQSLQHLVTICSLSLIAEHRPLTGGGAGIKSGREHQ